jgi:poly(hydroxyalkanoate) granule-associated protein
MENKLKNVGLGENFTKMVKDSANQIWLAGLGAFAKAQEEGSKLFESLVKEGEEIESRTKKAAEDKVEMAKNKTSDTWDKLEQVFEERVSRALSRLGVPTNDDIQSLSKRIEELNDNIKELIKSEEGRS